ncbi:YggT family protein [Vibrio sp. LaRot3]|uniref:YggT family protein n=1 Tax=Vibrio sp. LaRot3 TaxID=2998829 RepID=UPI0022CE1C76|nr:YggT family protein [Vibrio sp. LaRot3]MDA0148548.1 YggT family protein [Vibrio sp. LaRot3]
MSSMSFLISTLFDLYIMVVILRMWLQAARADFYNPFSQFVVNATQPVVGPLRRFIPSIGSIDLATLLFAYALMVGKFALIDLVAPGELVYITQHGYFLAAVFALFKTMGKILFYVLIARAILSWVSQGRSPVEYVFHQLTEPMLAPIRRVLPAMGGFDFSILVLFIALQFANRLVGELLSPLIGILWFQL